MRDKFIEQLDERQLLMRGNAYYRSACLLVFLMIMNFWLKDSLQIYWASNDWDYFLILFIAIAYTLIQMLHYDVYDVTTQRTRRIFQLLGVCGIGLFSGSIYHLIRNEIVLVEGNLLTSEAIMILFSILYIIIFTTYLFKRRKVILEEE